jgi:membrane fusion protein, heavy metal efflux system
MDHPTSVIVRSASRPVLVRSWFARGIGWVVMGLLVVGALAWWLVGRSRESGSRAAKDPAREAAKTNRGAAGVANGHAPPQREVVRLGVDQQRAVGLRTAPVTSGISYDVLTAPGRVAPNETQYAYITPRAAGVVRSVNAHVGQDVRAGDLLATIDSPVVGEARLELYTRLQTQEVARAQAAWQETIYQNTLELIKALQKGESPEEIHRRFKDRAVGENRVKLITAYAQYRLAIATIERNRELFAQNLITPKQFQQVNADFEVAQATYQSLMDQMGYEARLANTRARQAEQQAEAAVRTAQERLRILGVQPDGTEPEVAGGKVVGVQSDGTLPASEKAGPAVEKPETILPPAKDKEKAPVSTYSIWAPFDGTILDREMIVPGVAVNTAHRIFTMANLATVWIEANVHEGDFSMLARSRNGKVRFQAPAYPGREFEAEVIYAGDLVEERSRTVKLLARAQNPERLLKPGMFLEVEVLSPKPEPADQVPTSALLTQGDRTFVYVRTGPERFERREVIAGTAYDGKVAVRRGLEPGEEVVVEGGSKLKALSVQLASAAPES